MTHENHALISPHTYETVLIQAAVSTARTWRILINHIHKELQHLAIIAETGGRVRPVFNKRELLQVYVTTMDLIVTIPHGYVHTLEPKVELQDIFYLIHELGTLSFPVRFRIGVVGSVSFREEAAIVRGLSTLRCTAVSAAPASAVVL
jgi:hypothetical protein